MENTYLSACRMMHPVIGVSIQEGSLAIIGPVFKQVLFIYRYRDSISQAQYFKTG